MKIGIVGNGFVGNACYQYFKNYFNVLVFDKQQDRSLNTIEEVYDCKYIFVCLPTPMTSVEGGECNLSIIENFFDSVPIGQESIFIVKSTVPVGTTKKLCATRKDLNIVHNPEFLTAANAVEDFKNADRHVLGGTADLTYLVKRDIYDVCFPGIPVLLIDSEESEIVKYSINSFLALKVAFFNSIFQACEKKDINYFNVLNGILLDNRIGKSHTNIPGPDGDLGFGGTCFPKDVNSLQDFFDKNNIKSRILYEAWNYNKLIRKNWDWAFSSSAVLEKK